MSELEALIRSAKDYVQPSEDLRPRILEAARSQRRVMSCLRHAAAMLLMAGAFATGLHGMNGFVFSTTTPEQLLSSAAHDNWGLVDSFTELRRRQAIMLGSTVDFPPPKS
jgi:hypothetical protein